MSFSIVDRWTFVGTAAESFVPSSLDQSCALLDVDGTGGGCTCSEYYHNVIVMLFIGERPTSPDSDPNHNDEDGHVDENGQVSFLSLISFPKSTLHLSQILLSKTRSCLLFS